MSSKLLALMALFAGVPIWLTTLPPTAVSATPQLVEKADDVVLQNVRISKDGEVSGEVVK
jgi:hypothetical protein